MYSIRKAARDKELDVEIGQNFAVDCEEFLHRVLKASKVQIGTIISWVKYRSVPLYDDMIDHWGFATTPSDISSMGPLVR